MTLAKIRHQRGQTAFHAGAAAEYRIAQDYVRRGYDVAATRWRGAAGEIDLILRDGPRLVFVEVKQSRTLAQAAASLSRRQMQRIARSAQAFVADEPSGSLTDMRIDVALLDRAGDVQIIENAFGQC
ncbi:MAG: YraN family protein [Pseudomonadota bacterium]